MNRSQLKRRKGLSRRPPDRGDWIQARDAYLAENTACRACGGPSEVVHHVANRGVGFKDDRPENLQALCHRCHGELHAVGRVTFWARIREGE